MDRALDRNKTVVVLFVNTFLDVCRRDWQCAACFFLFTILESSQKVLVLILRTFFTQGLLKLLQTVYSEVYKTYHAQKSIKFALVVKFDLHHSTKIAKAWPGFDDLFEHPYLQMKSSRCKIFCHTKHFNFLTKTERAICNQLMTS